MAYYDRTIYPTNKFDVRCRPYHIYKCDVCGEESTFDDVPNFQYRERPCKSCKSMGISDRIKTLTAEHDTVLKQISELNVRLLNIDTEIRELTQELDAKNPSTQKSRSTRSN